MSTKYKTSDILFGLRQEYVELSRKLNLLSDLTDISMNKKITRIKYHVVPSMQSTKMDKTQVENPKVECTLIRNQKTLSCLFGLIGQIEKNVLGNYIYGIDDADVIRDASGRYIITRDQLTPTKGRFEAVILGKDQEMFAELVDELLKSEMYKIENQQVLTTEDARTLLTLYFSPILHGENGYCFHFLNSFNEALTYGEGELMSVTNNMFNQTFSEDSLTEYQKYLISKSGVQDKKIYIVGNRPTLDTAFFKIEEDENSIALIKKPKGSIK